MTIRHVSHINMPHVSEESLQVSKESRHVLGKDSTCFIKYLSMIQDSFSHATKRSIHGSATLTQVKTFEKHVARCLTHDSKQMKHV